jgi:hypothetical protein
MPWLRSGSAIRSRTSGQRLRKPSLAGSGVNIAILLMIASIA